MANAFKNYKSNGITAETTVLTGAAGMETTIIGMSIANVDTSDASINIKVGGSYMLKGAPVYVGGAMTPIGGEQKVVLMDGEDLAISSDYSVDVIVSVLEKG